MIIEVMSHRKGAIRYIFDNGNEVSIVFAAGSYSDNHDLDFETWYNRARIESTTVEIMVVGDAFARWFENKHEGQNPAGWIPVSEIPAILKRADSKASKPSGN